VQEEPLTTATLSTIISQAVAGAVNQAIGGVKSFVEDRLESQKTANESTSRELERLKAKKFQFRFKGNEEQANFNDKIVEYLDQSLKLIAVGSASATPIIEKAVSEIRQRNKHIKLADKSDAGWLAVDEYLADDLASDSDDDKKIRSAQARASAKKKKNITKSRNKPYQRKYAPVASPPNPASMPVATSGFFRRYSSYGNNPRSFSGGPKPTDFCFACGKTGHWRRNCPGVTANKQTSQKEGGQW